MSEIRIPGTRLRSRPHSDPQLGGTTLPVVIDRMLVEDVPFMLPRERSTVPQAKEPTGLPRKFTLPPRNRMENKGPLRREGDELVVLGELRMSVNDQEGAAPSIRVAS